MTAASKKPSWKALLAALLMGGAGAACGFLMAKFGMEMPLVRASLKTLSAWDLLMLPVLIVVVLAVHEAGHLAGGMSRGMRFLLFIAGPFGLVRTQEGIRFRWFFNLGTLGGIAAALPKSGQPLKPQLARLIVGGPLASLLLAFVALGLFWLFEGRAGAVILAADAGEAVQVFDVLAVEDREQRGRWHHAEEAAAGAVDRHPRLHALEVVEEA